MKAVIPCARKKESMFPFSETRPTPLIPVAGRKLITHLVENLKEAGIDEIYLVTNYMEDRFEEEFQGSLDVNLVHQESLDGTASAVSKCGFIQEDFLVVNGDVLVTSRDLKSLQRKFNETDSDAVMLAASDDSPEKFGVLSIENDRIKNIVEKPDEAENTLVNTGIYCFSPDIFDKIESTDSTSLTEVIRSLQYERTRFELIQDYWLDIGSPGKLLEADRMKREEEAAATKLHGTAEIHESAEITGEAIVGKNAEIKAGTVVEGRCVIGDGAEIGPGTVLKDSTVGDRSQVRNCSMDSSLALEDCILDGGVNVETSVLGEETDVKAGSVIRESFIGARSFIEMNNSIYGTKFVPDARTDLSEISK